MWFQVTVSIKSMLFQDTVPMKGVLFQDTVPIKGKGSAPPVEPPVSKFEPSASEIYISCIMEHNNIYVCTISSI